MTEARRFKARLVLLACLTPCWGLAQTSGGIFRGEIRDVSGGGVAQVRIRIQCIDSGAESLAESSSEGIYSSSDLIPGVYQLSVSHPGFRSMTIGPVTLQVNQAVRVDFPLTVGDQADSVSVTADATQLVASESAEIAQVITHRQVAGIPLNGRHWQQLITLSAGVNPGSPGETGSPNAVNVNGQRTKANLFLVDGVSTTSSMQGRGNNFNIPLEAVREFSVQSGAYSAEYGNVAGGVVNVQSKSGTKDWHGSAFEFFRNDKLDAANFFSNATGQKKNSLRYNEFGGSLGGPLRRDRTFVFADYQGTIAANAAPMVTTVRPSAQRRGDFSALKDGRGVQIPIYDPFGPSLARTPFPGNVIPETVLDPAAVKISSLLPQPNQFGADGAPLAFNNYAVTRAADSDFKAFDVRLDHQFTPGSSAFARHSFQNTKAVVPSIFGLPLGGTIAGAGTTRARNQSTAIGHNYQITPMLINEFRAGLNRQTTALRQEDYGRNLADEFGIPGVNRSSDTSGLPAITVSGVFGAGGSILTPLQVAATNWNWSDKLLWIGGRHTLRFGVDGQHEMGSSGLRVFGRGWYTFLNLSTSTAAGPPGGDAFASFMLGAPYQILRDDYPPGLAGLSSTHTGLFAQDDFKVTPRLSLNLGLRYEIMPYAAERYDRLSNFDPATRTMLLAGKTTGRRLRATDYKNFAPRIGLAYSPFSDAVIRAGYGIGFIDPVGAAGILNSPQFNIPFYFRDNITQFPFLPPGRRLGSELPPLTVPSPDQPTGDQRYLVPGDRNQYSQTWSLSLQKAWTKALLLELAYVGTSGSRLLMTSNINAAPPGATNPVARRPFGSALGEIRAFSNGAHSTYHGMQARVEQHLSHGLYFLGAYTWSKSIDNQSTGTDDSAAGGQSPQNPANYSLDRAPSNFDRTHRMVVSLVWTLPFAARHPVWGGWQVSGVTDAQTGAPFSVLMPCASINAEGNNCRPNVLRDPALSGDQRTLARWFDPSAFAIPSPAAYGNSGRNLLRAPGSFNCDVAIAKSLPWGPSDQRRIRLRGEFFNVFNHANFGVPVHTVDSPAVGTISSAAPGRVIQLSARVEF
ncbi:TonB-dependent receptor [uncultured Paludibaculum sp.]|uniref:TonB-dependent receptor n=1 Tax=uncultured Paludibaculum sp. TaxID=1765020 RepID=UPI002AAC061F|nr:TonB-dependent receptor [uncultured Paludibaculum sp.]